MKFSEGVIGLISNIDAETMRVKLKLSEQDDFETDWLPVIVIPGTFYVPKVQDQVFAVMDEHFDVGVVVGGVYNDPQFSDADLLALKFPGVEMTINKQTGEVKVTGDKILVTGSEVTFDADNTVITGKLEVQGDANLKAKASVAGDLDIKGDTTAAKKITAVGIIKSNVDVQTLTVKLNTHMHPTAAVGPPSPPIPTP